MTQRPGRICSTGGSGASEGELSDATFRIVPSGVRRRRQRPVSRRSRRRSGRARRRAPRSVCSPSHGTRVSGPSATPESFTGLPGMSTGCSTPSVRGSSTSMWRAATCGSTTTSSSVKHGPAAMPAAPSSPHASTLLRSAAHDSMAGRSTASRLSSQPCRVAKRGIVDPLGMADERDQLRELLLAARPAR